MKAKKKIAKQPAKQMAVEAPEAVLPPHSQNWKAQTPNLHPSAIELAKLAAIIAPNAQDGAAIKRAMEQATRFYVEATYFVKELPTDENGMLSRFGSEDRNWAHLEKEVFPLLIAEKERELQSALTLDPSQDNDEVRDYLSERGIRLKTHRAVLDNIREMWGDRAERLFNPTRIGVDDLIAGLKPAGAAVYKIPTWILDCIVSFKKRRRGERGQKSWQTRSGESSENGQDEEPASE